MAQFSLQWEAYKQNVCDGLSFLQQNGELVDVTLAADGHLVRVHRLVLSLASPYLKELLASATDCNHPVVFLNKISYPTLCAILEYIYSGQAMVTREQLPDLVQACRELRIKGLEDMSVEVSLEQGVTGMPLSERSEYFKSEVDVDERREKADLRIMKPNTINSANKSPNTSLPLFTENLTEEANSHVYDDTIMETDTERDSDWAVDNNPLDNKTQTDTSQEGISKMQKPELTYGLSNQGRLQLIMNRYVYNLRYTSSKGSSGHRQWKCCDYSRPNISCKASVHTKDDVVIKRISVHNHPFHDKKILKKVRDNAVYATLQDAETMTFNKKATE